MKNGVKIYDSNNPFTYGVLVFAVMAVFVSYYGQIYNSFLTAFLVVLTPIVTIVYLNYNKNLNLNPILFAVVAIVISCTFTLTLFVANLLMHTIYKTPPMAHDVEINGSFTFTVDNEIVTIGGTAIGKQGNDILVDFSVPIDEFTTEEYLLEYGVYDKMYLTESTTGCSYFKCTIKRNVELINYN